MARRVFLILVALSILLVQASTGEEGMYPISASARLNLKSKGLKIDPGEIYNPSGTSLTDAIVSLGGCSGSFVSNDGLIITNHHCVFSSVQSASTVEHDYLTNGFLAPTRPQELRTGLTARITEQMRDVSADVLSAASDSLAPLERSKAIEDRINTLTKQAEKEFPGKSISISEMLAGKSYVMFVSTTLRDVRLVYVPPRSIGEFGGEDDNWTWPRHTGDFSFVRAYVGSDGKPAAYAQNNVPFHPKRFLKVNPSGVNEGDFVFILGYPGRTYRHQTSYYMAYEENIRMPFIVDLNDWLIRTMQDLGKDSRAVALKFDARIKRLANTMKNYRGKLAGMRRLQLVAAKRAEEVLLQQYVDADPQRKATCGTVLSQISRIYEEMSARAQYELVLDNLESTSLLLRLGNMTYAAGKEMGKPGAERAAAYRDSTLAETRKTAGEDFANYYEPAEKLFLNKMLALAGRLPQGRRIAAFDDALHNDYSEANISRFVDDVFAKTTLKTASGIANALGKTEEEVDRMNDPFVNLAKALSAPQQELRDLRQRRDAELSKLSALLLDVKQKFLQKDFIPDANRTLRLTYGHIRGYSPADATYLEPITTLTGVMQKTTEEYPYATPQKVRELYGAKDYGRFKLPKRNELPVALLYDADTTGGNSGSPLMNSRGELVGVNFDRAWGATINDYAWNEAYSRSIAVDIRYVLWVTEKVGGAGFLLQELGVK